MQHKKNSALNTEKILYLEVDPISEGLRFPSIVEGVDFFDLGDLYAMSTHRFPERKYMVRFYDPEKTAFDKLKRVSRINQNLYLYQLESLSIKHPHANDIFFLLELTMMHFKEFPFVWVVRELNPEVLDEIEYKTGYNLVGSIDESNND